MHVNSVKLSYCQKQFLKSLKNCLYQAEYRLQGIVLQTYLLIYNKQKGKQTNK